MKILIIIAALFLGIAFSACEGNRNTNNDTAADSTLNKGNTDADTSARIGAYWDNERDYTFEEKDSFKRQQATALERLDKKIDSLESKARTAKGERKENYEQAIKDLKERRKDVKEKADETDIVSKDEWNGFKEDVKSAWNDVEESWNGMIRDLRENDEKK